MRPWRRLVDREIERLWADVADLRDGLVDLDHAKAPRAHVAEVLTRVNLMAEIVAANEDDISSLRNDYRGEEA